MKKIIVCLMMSCLLFGLMTSCGSTNSAKEFEEEVSAEEIESDTDTSTEDETVNKDDYKNSCVEVTDFAILQRESEEVLNKDVTVTGTVSIIIDNGETAGVGIDFGEEANTILVNVKYDDNGKFAEGDTVQFWGQYMGTSEDTGEIESSPAAPFIDAKYYEIVAMTDGLDEDETEESEYDDEEAENEEHTDIAVYEETEAKITGAEITETDDGIQIIRVYFNFTNYSDKGLYMYESFVVKAFQNGKELTDITDINDDSESVNLIKEVKDGASIEGSYVFELTDGSEVEIRVITPTADEEVLISETF